MSKKTVIFVVIVAVVVTLLATATYTNYADNRRAEAQKKEEAEAQKKAGDTERKFWGTEFSKGDFRPM